MSGRHGYSRAQLSILLALLGIMISCGTTGEGRPEAIPERSEVVREELQERIAEGTPERAIERIARLREQEVLSGNELDRLRERAVEELRGLYGQARNDGAYREAQRRLSSLQVAAPDSAPGSDQLYLSWALAEEAAGNRVTALQLFGDMEDYSLLTDDLLLRFAEYAGELGSRESAERLALSLRLRGLPAPDNLKSEEPGEVSRQALSGTVTIWVNRGIRMEQGAGVPDRVIGSGFFIDPRGYLITNYHVIRSEVDPEYEGYSRLFIRLPGSPDTRIPARVVGYDRLFDVALLKTELDAPEVFSFTDIRELEPGSSVFAIGSPGGLDNSITSGIISATGRRFLQMGDALQIDVPVNPGSSGGPLLTPEGDLVGVIFAGIPQFQGVNFAVPSFWVRQLVPRLYDGGEVAHSWLGVALREAADGLAVSYVAPNSPAKRIGLRRDDVITRVAGTRVRTLAEAQDVLLDYLPATLTNVAFRRGQQALEREVVVDERPFSPLEYALKYQQEDQVFAPLFGMEVSDISTLPWQNKYVVTDVYPGSIADETGLSPQDPFSLRKWQVDYERRIALAQIIIQKRKAGFIESGVQLASYLEQDNFL